MTARTEAARRLDTSPSWRVAVRRAWPLRARLAGPASAVGFAVAVLWGWR